MTRYTQQSKLFKYQALNCFRNAGIKLSSQSELFFHPYYDDSAQRVALSFPFLHAAQCVGNIVSMAYGVYLLGKSIMTLQGPLETLKMGMATFLLQGMALLLNVCNLVMSLCSLGTRLAATIVNGGVVASTIEHSAGQDTERLSDRINEDANTRAAFQFA